MKSLGRNQCSDVSLEPTWAQRCLPQVTDSQWAEVSRQGWLYLTKRSQVPFAAIKIQVVVYSCSFAAWSFVQFGKLWAQPRQSPTQSPGHTCKRILRLIVSKVNISPCQREFLLHALWYWWWPSAQCCHCCCSSFPWLHHRWFQQSPK